MSGILLLAEIPGVARVKHLKHSKHLLPQFFITIQSNLLTECIQDQFLKDCT